MERITIPGYRYYDDEFMDSGVAKFFNRLAAYEDTGLEPEEVEQLKGEVFGLKIDKQELEKYRALGHIDHIHELVQAKKDGRLVVLPCKVWDTVYAAETRPVIPLSVAYVGVYLDGADGGDWEALENIGKTVFLTREEAEAALAGKDIIPCKHGLSKHRNEIGEDEVYCELNAKWMNVTLGDCLGNCESEAALAGKGGED